MTLVPLLNTRGILLVSIWKPIVSILPSLPTVLASRHATSLGQLNARIYGCPWQDSGVLSKLKDILELVGNHHLVLRRLD